MNPNVDERLARDLAEDTVDLFEQGDHYRVSDALRAMVDRDASYGPDAASPDTIGRAYGLACNALGVKPKPGVGFHIEQHPDGSERKSDEQVGREVLGRIVGRS